MKRDKNIKQTAAELGISESVIRDYVRLGCPCDRRRGKPSMFAAAEVAAWMQSNNRTGRPGRPTLTGSEALDAAKLRKEVAMGRYYEIRNAKASGELIAIAEVQRLGAETLRLIISKLKGFGAALVPRIEGRQPHEQLAIVDEMLGRIVNETGSEMLTIGERAAELADAVDDADLEAEQPQPTPAPRTPKGRKP